MGLLFTVCIGVHVRVRDDRPRLHCVGECLSNKMCVGVKRPRQEEGEEEKNSTRENSVDFSLGLKFIRSVFSCWEQQ